MEGCRRGSRLKSFRWGSVEGSGRGSLSAGVVVAVGEEVCFDGDLQLVQLPFDLCYQLQDPFSCYW